MNLKLIASDLDGTLLTDEKEVTAYTRALLAQAAAQGIHFVPATGRAFASVPEHVLTLPGVEYIITSNGAGIYSVSQKKRIYSCAMDPASIDAILCLLQPKRAKIRGDSRKEGADDGTDPAFSEAESLEKMVLEAYIEGIPYADARYVKQPELFGASGYGIGYVKRTRRPVEDMRRFLKQQRERLDSLAFVSADPGLLQEFRGMLEHRVPRIMTTSSFPHLLEVGHCDAGKGKTLLRLLELLEIRPGETAAFGDASNDLDMLQSVRYGIAMGNAVQICKDAAYFVTDTNEEDGVAKAVQKLMDI